MLIVLLPGTPLNALESALGVVGVRGSLEWVNQGLMIWDLPKDLLADY
jgi:hypothetical protein